MIRSFGKRYDYDIGYMLLLLDETPSLMNAFNGLSKLSGYRKKAPVEAYIAAKLTGVGAEDCGPCLQLAVDMAREDGVAGSLIEAILAGDEGSMCTDSALGFRFASAILARSDDEDAARAAVRNAYGEAAVVELTLATQINRVFPMVKRGLGYDKSCNRITVGGRQIDVVRDAA
jgi:alkylhydroperoxidase family enzyme